MGESNRAIAHSELNGRKKAQKLRNPAVEHGWLDKLNPLPDDAQLATVLNVTVHTPSSSVSSVLPHTEKVNKWIESGVQGSTIHQKLVDSYGVNYHNIIERSAVFYHIIIKTNFLALSVIW
jgi:hypothetical protein